MTGFFDTFTDKEHRLMETILNEVKDQAWAHSNVSEIKRNGGLCGANMARLFELRCGHSFYKAGITPSYEVAGEGNSTLDWGFTSGGKAWRVELMRLDESDAAKAATKTETAADGTVWKQRILSSSNKEKTQSPEGEMLKAIERICGKFVDKGKPTKFPMPDGAYHALLVDLRNFANKGGDKHDRLHIGLGWQYVPKPFRLYWGEGEKRKPISGVFSPHNKMLGATEAQERVHFIGFVNEQTFEADEFACAIQFIANPHIIPRTFDIETAMQSWPLSRCVVLGSAARPR